MSNAIMDHLLEAKQNDIRIALYGAGQRGKLAYFEIIKYFGLEYKEHIVFIDSNESKQGTKLEGIMIYSINDAVPDDHKILILITADCYRPIYSTIKRYNIELLKNTFYWAGGMNWEVNYPGDWDEKEFIRQNINDFEKIYNMLEDNVSRRIYSNLLNYRLTRESRYILESFSNKGHYFDYDIFGEDGKWFKEKQRTYLDVGAYTGDTLKELLDINGEYFTKILCFETDYNYCEQIRKKYNTYNNILVYDLALGDQNGTVNFDSRFIGTGSNRISLTGNEVDANIQQEMIRFDDLPVENKIDFVKMDIEGGEFAALLGMQETIKRDKPVMAISVYHCQDDMIRIPKLLKEYVPEYKLYLRHYSEITDETVLYAVLYDEEGVLI